MSATDRTLLNTLIDPPGISHNINKDPVDHDHRCNLSI